MAQMHMHVTYLDGKRVEYWDDSEHPFPCRPQDLAGYAAAGCWIHLFNALCLLGMNGIGRAS